MPKEIRQMPTMRLHRAISSLRQSTYGPRQNADRKDRAKDDELFFLLELFQYGAFNAT
jgi:hypothetical protein